MFRAYVTVHDKRTCSGDRTKFECFETIEECIRWARKVKNRIFNEVIVCDLTTDHWTQYSIQDMED